MTNLEKRNSNNSVYIIAEMSGNHGGNLSKALDIVHAASEARADCLKIQTYTPDTITINCHSDYFLVKGGLWDKKNLYDLYSEAFTPWEWTLPIKEECQNLGLDFLSTPFDFSSVDFLEDVGIDFYKIASPEIIDLPLIEYVAKKMKPIFLSTGMATEEEISDAVNTIRATGNNDFYLLQCCSQYPADFANMNLSLLKDMQQRFSCKTGLSDHSFGSLGPVTATTLGASVIEKHLCLSRKDKSADSKFSMEPDEFKKMVEDVRNTEVILGQPIYGPSKGEERGLRNRRSLFAVKDIAQGEELTAENVRSIRPGQGLPPKYYYRVIGQTAKVDIPFGTPLSWDLISLGD